MGEIMEVLLTEIIRAILIAVCIIAPAWAFVKSEDGEEM